MDERFGLLGQFLHQDMEVFALPGKGLSQIFYALGVGADAFAHAQQVGRGDVHVAAFGAGMVVPGSGIEQFGTEEMAEDGLIDECFALSHLETHGVDEHTVVDSGRGIAREEQVV